MPSASPAATKARLPPTGRVMQRATGTGTGGATAGTIRGATPATPMTRMTATRNVWLSRTAQRPPRPDTTPTTVAPAATKTPGARTGNGMKGGVGANRCPTANPIRAPQPTRMGTPSTRAIETRQRTAIGPADTRGNTSQVTDALCAGLPATLRPRGGRPIVWPPPRRPAGAAGRSSAGAAAALKERSIGGAGDMNPGSGGDSFAPRSRRDHIAMSSARFFRFKPAAGT